MQTQLRWLMKSTMFAIQPTHLRHIPYWSQIDVFKGTDTWLNFFPFLTLVMLNKLRCPTHFQILANQITLSRWLKQIHILNDEQCRSRSVGFFRSQLIWIYTVCKGRTYPRSAGLRLTRIKLCDFLFAL